MLRSPLHKTRFVACLHNTDDECFLMAIHRQPGVIFDSQTSSADAGNLNHVRSFLFHFSLIS